LYKAIQIHKAQEQFERVVKARMYPKGKHHDDVGCRVAGKIRAQERKRSFIDM
jgi:hypothetical protein